MMRKLSRREELYGKKQNDDFGCLLMFLGGPLPFRLISILFVSFVIILFQNFFSNDDSKSHPKNVYQYDHQRERTGMWTWHYPNGVKELEGPYKSGERNGIWTAWWKNGKVKWMYSYRMGTLDGKCSDWYENGQKASDREFLAGHLATASVWLPDGEVCSRSKVEDGEGRFIIHGQKGIPTRALTYRNGKKVRSHLINTIPIIR